MNSSAQQRRRLILDELARTRTVGVAELSRDFGVSEVLIRRDLSRMHEQGLLKRIHGGAVALPHGTTATIDNLPRITNREERERVGRAAAEMICPGDRIIFDSGETCLQVARHISGDLLTHGQLTAITSSLPIVYELGPWKGVHVLLLGGIYLPDHQMVVGPQTVQDLQGLHADRMFLGADGLTGAHGLTTANVLEAEAERAMVKAASQVIAVADSSKIGRIGLATILPLNQINILITDQSAPAAFVSELRDLGVQVVLA
jgi:DeoR/GlpR family transcriptional regulator of sugar metabolism